MGPKRRKLLDDSWAGLFRREILPELPVEKIAPAFDEINGRPTKEMYTTLGALIFQQMLDLDDEETVRQLAFSIEWHFALDLDGESDAAKYICPRTLWTMRGILTKKKLDTILFSQITDKLRPGSSPWTPGPSGSTRSTSSRTCAIWGESGSSCG